MYNEHKKEASARQLEALNLEAENQAVKKFSVDCSTVQSFQNGKDLTKVSAVNEMKVVVTEGGVENKAFVVENSDRIHGLSKLC
jgi:hypothetical protein